MNQNNFATKEDLTNLETRLEKKIAEVVNVAFDKLAVMVAIGFEETATKVELRSVEKRLDGVEHRLDGVEANLDSLKTQSYYMKEEIKNINIDTPSNSGFQNHEKRIRKLEKAALV